MSTSSSQMRFHSLDALRGWAMLLGIVLHAAWIMASRYSGTPITDADGSYASDYVCYIIHIFRLQTFFVMAGFFAHLVFTRRGQWGFLWHRVSRIGIPLIVGWLIMYPIMTFQYVAGGLQSGRVISDQGFWPTAFAQMLAEFKINPQLTHLWFLYDLMAVYVLAVLIRVLFQYILDRQGKLRRLIDRSFASLTHSRWLILVLAIPSGMLLFFEQFWWGLDGYPQWFVPPWPGLLGYWLFFSVGWLLYGQWHLLEVVSRNWQRKLVVGVVLSIPLFMVTTCVDLYGTYLYPVLTDPEIRDLSGFRSAATSPQLSPQRRVWQSLSPLYQEYLTDRTAMSSDQKAGLAMELNTKVVSNPTFYAAEYWQHETLPDDISLMLAEHESGSDQSQVGRLNRRLLELALPGSIATNMSEQPVVKLAKVAFSAGYAIAMWCLVFGVIGAFDALFPHPSRVSRYIADASYWVYLLHLPVMFQIELWLADSRWGFGGIPKFLFYSAATAAVCFVTYHYLVRSTFIGRVLNGQAYPFVPLFGKRSSAEPATGGTAVPAPHPLFTASEKNTVPSPHLGHQAGHQTVVPGEIEWEAAD